MTSDDDIAKIKRVTFILRHSVRVSFYADIINGELLLCNRCASTADKQDMTWLHVPK